MFTIQAFPNGSVNVRFMKTLSYKLKEINKSIEKVILSNPHDLVERYSCNAMDVNCMSSLFKDCAKANLQAESFCTVCSESTDVQMEDVPFNPRED